MKLKNTNQHDELLKQIAQLEEIKSLQDKVRDQKLAKASSDNIQQFDNSKFFKPIIEKLDEQIRIEKENVFDNHSHIGDPQDQGSERSRSSRVLRGDGWTEVKGHVYYMTAGRPHLIPLLDNDSVSESRLYYEPSDDTVKFDRTVATYNTMGNSISISNMEETLSLQLFEVLINSGTNPNDYGSVSPNVLRKFLEMNDEESNSQSQKATVIDELLHDHSRPWDIVGQEGGIDIRADGWYVQRGDAGFLSNNGMFMKLSRNTSAGKLWYNKPSGLVYFDEVPKVMISNSNLIINGKAYNASSDLIGLLAMGSNDSIRDNALSDFSTQSLDEFLDIVRADSTFNKKSKAIEVELHGRHTVGKGLLLFPDLKSLINKLNILIGEMQAGNTSSQIRKDAVEIIDYLLKEGEVSASEHKESNKFILND